MKKYKEILRYHNAGLSQRQIAEILGVSRGTVVRAIDGFKALAIPWEEVIKLSEKDLEDLLFVKRMDDAMYLKPDYEVLIPELSIKGVTKKLLWEEYVRECDAAGKVPYQYTQFCVRMNKFIEVSKASMHFTHVPGEKIEVDWAGKTIPITDYDTGEISKAYLFVGVLPYSQYVYAEVTNDMKEENWIMAHVHMFNYFKGTTPILVCDNLKTGVIKHPKNGEIVLNDAYKELADYYDIAIIPAAPLTPKGKPSAEGNVGKLTMDILARLRNSVFYNVHDANLQVKQLLKQFNDRKFQKREGSRISVFLLEEYPKLKQLPKEPYEYGEWKQATVQYNYHVFVDKMYYSVPYGYIHKRVNIRITANMIEIFLNHNRICSHIRLRGRIGQYSTNADHMPPNHKYASEWNGDRFLNWARKIGPNTTTVIRRLLDSYKVEQQAYNGCRAILKLSEQYSPAKLEKTCENALNLIHTPRYKNIKLIIEHIQEVEEPNTKEKNTGAFLRGSTYYGGSKNE